MARVVNVTGMLILGGMVSVLLGTGCPPVGHNMSKAMQALSCLGIQSCVPPIYEMEVMLPGDVPLELVWVPAGSFQMGRYADEQQSGPNEDPQHLVTFSSGFWMGKYEVTQQQWLALMISWPYASMSLVPDATFGLGDTYPAYYVSWNNAKDFITALNVYITRTDQGPLTAHLPSEAEWEYACRAGTQTRFYWGDDSGETQIGDYAWYLGNNEPNGSKPVGGKEPNGFGLYDMAGNVMEMCEDTYHNRYTGAPTDGSAWVAPLDESRMVRGGNSQEEGSLCRSAQRLIGGSYTPANGIGFRVAAVDGI